jgi:hypothetical protein
LLEKERNAIPHRGLRWGARAALLIPFLLLVENLLLWSPLVPLALEMAPPLRLKYDFAWSLVPGRVHIYGLHMTVEDRVVQMQIDARSADARFVLSDLFRKKLHIQKLDAEGLRLLMRPVVTEKGASAAWVKAVPPISGFPDPPLWRHPERTKKPTEKLWKFRLTNISASLEELWLGPVHFEGPGNIEGGFELHPRTMLHLLPTKLSLGGKEQSLTTKLGRMELSQNAHLNLEAEVSPLYFHETKDFLSLVRLNLEGNFPFLSLEAVNAILPAMGFGLGAARGELQLNLALEKGRFTQEARGSLKAESAGLELKHGLPSKFFGPLEVDVTFHSVERNHEISAHLTWRDLEWHTKMFNKSPATIRQIQAETKLLLSPDLKLVPETSKMRLEDFSVPDLRFFQPLLKDAPFELRGGSASLNVETSAKGTEDIDASVELRIVSAKLKLTTEKDKKGAAEKPVLAEFSSVLLAEGNFHPQTQKLEIDPVTLQLSPLSVQWEGHDISWPFVLSTTHTELDLEQEHRLSYLDLQGPSLEPVLESFVKKGIARWAGKLALGEGGTTARIRLETSKAASRLDLLAFKSGRIAVDGVAVTGEKTGGAFLIIAPVARVGIALAEDAMHIHPTASRHWLKEELARQKIPVIEHDLVKPGHHDETANARRAARRARHDAKHKQAN